MGHRLFLTGKVDQSEVLTIHPRRCFCWLGQAGFETRQSDPVLRHSIMSHQLAFTFWTSIPQNHDEVRTTCIRARNAQISILLNVKYLLLDSSLSGACLELKLYLAGERPKPSCVSCKQGCKVDVLIIINLLRCQYRVNMGCDTHGWAGSVFLRKGPVRPTRRGVQCSTQAMLGLTSR